MYSISIGAVFTPPTCTAFREIAETPRVRQWQNQVIGFIHRLSSMRPDSIHVDLV